MFRLKLNIYNKLLLYMININNFSNEYWSSLSIYISNYIYHNYDKFINNNNKDIINKKNNLYRILKNQSYNTDDKMIFSQIYSFYIISKLMI